ncbi:ScbR family autoregulator-binding transcription factor [Jonesia denitrificans]|uniref:Transcriptional regulator, TetR family n=1 Tax=Jonesia denitrificans (strain ATCC 14870 / DSM 20603 / BCRC 15368 / CIP 55.134 / JCM 11481 / NBRC 15587 / NCTC 10816 / Prevot 55134) TaxID=471856 RepID=C7R5A8_JONDD|nr:ScbR family autoregulator-binding transcription factor [Jonesia denitrificans]ACV07786.1 transcriptional regulator, TetR family [Jonesia denitrificans DSM 20603]QXB43104.1 TetR/AcrR family transcriptional regulator [Jonesia denitrificans]SQH19759.1 A-factor-binding protein [Jonesia denitrificans]
MSTREEQKHRTRTTILRIAAEEFDERGYAAVSLNDIAARLHVTKGTVYFHFPSKSALALAVVDTYVARWSALQQEMTRLHLTGLSALVWLSHQVAVGYRDDPGVRAPLRLMRESAVIDGDLPTPFVPWIKTVAQHVVEAQQQGHVRDDVDANIIAWQVVASFFGAQELSHQLSSRGDLTDRVTTMWQLFLPGIMAPGVALPDLTPPL